MFTIIRWIIKAKVCFANSFKFKIFSMIKSFSNQPLEDPDCYEPDEYSNQPNIELDEEELNGCNIDNMDPLQDFTK